MPTDNPIPIVDIEAEADESVDYGAEVEDYTVVDLDAHYMDSYEDIAAYMEEPWRSRLLGSGFEGNGSKQNITAMFPHSTGDRQQYGKVVREHSSYPDDSASKEEVLDAMEFLGIDIQVQISHVLLTSNAVTADDKRVAQFAKGYAEYVLDNVIDPDAGIYGLLALPPLDIDVGLDLIERVADEEGLVGACLITSGARPLLGNRRWDPLYERAEKLDVPMVFHTSGAGLDQPEYAGARSFLETHTLGFLQSNQAQLASLVFQGVPERFPDLDVVIMESGVTYLPALMARMDEEYLKRSEEAPLLEKRPSEYLTDFYYGTQPLEKKMDIDYLETCIDLLGTDSLIYASDYPHWDFDRPTSITNLPFLSDEEKREILSGNAMEVFDF
jgi:predicted TIM-barrel fold metal-dependent hydrolase